MPKLLADFLLDHQDPFVLDVYLVERGYSKNRARFCKGRWLRKKRDAVPNCVDFARAVFSRLIILHNDNGKIKNGTNTTSRGKDDDDDADKKLSPVSVLQETESDKMKNYNINSTTTQGESSLTHDPYNQYIINKRALRQTKQLLIDCVREMIEKQREIEDKSGQKQKKRVLGSEELWKHVCEKVWLWSQNTIHETNVIHLLKYDFMEEEWGMLHKEEVYREIGDAILDSVICETFC